MAIEFKKYIEHESCLSDLEKLNKDLNHIKNMYTDILIENGNNGLTTSELQVELKRQLDLQQSLVDAFNNEMFTGTLKSYKFEPKRKKGSIGKKQKHINELVKNNPQKTAKELRKIADETILGSMKDSTFANNVIKAFRQE